MIDVIVNAIKKQLTELGTVGRIGGIARPVEQTTFVGDEETTYTFPASDDVDNLLCWETGRYEALSPNSDYETVIYFEQTGDLVDTSDTFERMDMQGSIRLVCWMNYEKLGPADQKSVTLRNYKSRLIMDFRKKLNENNRKIAVTQTGITNSRVLIRSVNVVNESEDLFSDFSLPQEFTMFPFSSFGLDIGFTFVTSPDCWTAVTDGDDWECIDYNDDNVAETIPPVIGDDRGRVIGDPDRGISIGRKRS